ncbi:MAG: MFS transporter [Verrucomicrobiales bacterium]
MNTSTERAAETAMTLRQYSILVCWGMVVTNLGQFSSLGDLPIKFLLKDGLKVSQTEIAAWLGIAILPWSFKPLAALLVDGVPLKGTKHRHYLLLGLVFSGTFWLAMGVIPPQYHTLLFFGTCLNVMMMLTSTVVGGLLVEGGQAHGATGRLSSIRMIVANVILLFVGPLGGFLAGKWFGWTAIIGGVLFFSMIPLTLLLLREKRVSSAHNGDGPLFGIAHQCRMVFRSRNLWICSGLLFLVSLAPGFGVPLLFYQTNQLGFDPMFIGLLKTYGAPMGLLAALLYPLLCRKLNLRALLYMSISSTAICALLYLGYVSKSSAIAIEALYVLGYTLAQLPLFDLAARATPKGSEALGYAVMMAVWNLSNSVSEVLGAHLSDVYKFTFNNLVWLNAGTTALILLIVPFLPAFLVDKKEGEI